MGLVSLRVHLELQQFYIETFLSSLIEIKYSPFGFPVGFRSSIRLEIFPDENSANSMLTVVDRAFHGGVRGDDGDNGDGERSSFTSNPSLKQPLPSETIKSLMEFKNISDWFLYPGVVSGHLIPLFQTLCFHYCCHPNQSYF